MESRHGVITNSKEEGEEKGGGVRGRGGRGEGDKEGGGVVVENCMCMCMCVSISFILLMIKCESFIHFINNSIESFIPFQHFYQCLQ